MQNAEFEEMIWRQGDELFRPMPWRDDTRPYYVLVSELMLQQTQVSRVIPKFDAFIEHFPDERALASASLADVLRLWQGLGYNRRAKFLHEAAKMIMTDFNGRFPESETDILKLPGVGKNTLGAIRAYAFNQPALFIETNIRTVYMHHFFAGDFDVDDKSILKKLEETLPTEGGKEERGPRVFYWALMDYGSWLKANGVRNNDQSKHYKKQSPLEGSVRQVRGRIIAVLGKHETMNTEQLQDVVEADERYKSALAGLVRDGLVTLTDDLYHLTK